MQEMCHSKKYNLSKKFCCDVGSLTVFLKLVLNFQRSVTFKKTLCRFVNYDTFFRDIVCKLGVRLVFLCIPFQITTLFKFTGTCSGQKTLGLITLCHGWTANQSFYDFYPERYVIWDREGTNIYTHTGLLLNIPVSWEFTFLALQKNHSCVFKTAWLIVIFIEIKFDMLFIAVGKQCIYKKT